jgi:hypothetical protein
MVDLLNVDGVACAGLSVTHQGDARDSGLLQSTGRIFLLFPKCSLEPGGQWFGFAVGKHDIRPLSQHRLHQPQLTYEAATIAAHRQMQTDAQPHARRQTTIHMVARMLFVQFTAAQHVPVSS